MPRLAQTFRLLVALCSAATLSCAAWAQAAPQGQGALPSVAAPEAQRRVALVVGNAAYDTAPLSNPVNDAQAMAQVLRDAGFTVLLHTDVDQRQLMDAVREFGERLKAGGGTGLFYFAGHGMQIKGRNFLIPVRSNIVHEDEVAYAALDTQAVLDKMESAGNGTNILVLDACRNNPFARSFRSGQQGLAQMDAPVGTLISFATAPGSVAIDNLPGQRNGLFTTHLLEAVRRPGLKVEDVLKQVRQAVLRASSNRQVPWESSALVGDFYFHPPTAVPGAAGAGPAAAQAAVDPRVVADDALWEAVRDGRDSTELFAYLRRFPDGRHAGEARQRLSRLTLTQSAESSTLSTPPGDTDALERLSEGSARVRRDLAAAVALSRQPQQLASTWGGDAPAAGAERPPSPQRNANGFAVGDRFRYRLTDLSGRPHSRTYVWRVDRIEPDGGLWVNDGRQRLDPLGQRRGGNDELTGTWIDFAPALPLSEALAQGPGHQGPVSTTVTERGADGRVTRTHFDGVWRTAIDEVDTPQHFDTRRVHALVVEVSLLGTVAGEASQRVARWLHRYWFVKELRLPMRIAIDDRLDGTTVRRARHELIAVDLLAP